MLTKQASKYQELEGLKRQIHGILENVVIPRL